MYINTFMIVCIYDDISQQLNRVSKQITDSRMLEGNTLHAFNTKHSPSNIRNLLKIKKL